MKTEFSAGGVIVRRFRGRPFAAIVLVRKHGVWALPKGHPEPDETPAETAAREVREETGLDGRLVEHLHDIVYWYTRKKGGRVRKTVSFFLFDYSGGRLADHDSEVLDARWVPLEDAASLLSYSGERRVAEIAAARAQSGK